MEQPKRKANRLPDYDYSTHNAYFLTVCLNDRQNLFWQPVGATIGRPHTIQLTRCGQIVDQAIRSIPAHYPAVTVDQYVIMPDHVHLLLQIHEHDGRAMLAPTEIGEADGRAMLAPTISRIMQQFKGSVTKQLGMPIWQKGFYDHIIRDENDYRSKWQYIEGNKGKLAEKRHWDQFLSWED